MKRKFSVLVCLILSICAYSQVNYILEPGIYAEIVTSKGTIVCQLHYRRIPITTAHFIALSEGKISHPKFVGKKFYENNAFHRVEPNFMIQGGAGASSGLEDLPYSIPDEISSDLKHNSEGILSMANAGRGTGNNQFFITHKNTSWLDGKHTIFGRVIYGQSVVNTIAKGDKILSINIIREGQEAKKYDPIKTLKEANVPFVKSIAK